MPRQARGRSAKGQVDVNLTPLLDVVLQLITFFMMLVHFGTRIEGASALVRLPVAPAGLPGGNLAVDRLVAVIDERGALIVEGKALEGTAAEAWWVDQAEQRWAGLETLDRATDELPTQVVIRADKDASYGAVRRALVAGQGRGFANFSLVVLRSVR